LELSLGDFASLNALNADRNTADGSVDVGFNRLKIRQEAAEIFSNDLGAGAAFSFDHTAPDIFVTG